MIKQFSKKEEKAHRIGHCLNCGWVHREIRRVRVEEVYSGGTYAVIKPLCVKCIKEQRHQVICDLCGRVECDNLYPVSIMRKMIGELTCKLFVHLCAECRNIPHTDILKRFKVPNNICDTCNDRFECFTNKGEKPFPSMQVTGTLQGKKTSLHKGSNPNSILRFLGLRAKAR